MEGDVSRLIREASVLIGENSIIFEAGVIGTPFVCIRKELTVTINPLDHLSERFECCRSTSPRELDMKLVRCVNCEGEFEVPLRQELAETLRKGFAMSPRRESEVFQATISDRYCNS